MASWYRVSRITSQSVGGNCRSVLVALCAMITVTALTGRGVWAGAALPLMVAVKPVGGVTVRHAYDRAEFAVDVSGGAVPYANPFDPDEVTVDAVFDGPHRVEQRIPGFWYVPYRRGVPADKTGFVGMVPVPGGAPGWRVRAALPSAGTWRLTVRVKDRSGTAVSDPLTVRVSASDSPGFVRRATGAGRKRYLQYDSGASFFPVGENVCWSNAKGLADYDIWFPALAKAGGNYARLWMAFAPLESKATGLGRYDMQNAAYYDAVLDEAQRNGLRCMVALDTYGSLATDGYFHEGQWPNNPYNKANGGPVPADDPKAFFTDADARRLYRQRLRYLVARYSAYTSVGFWEFWNEQDGPGPWFAEMAAYVRHTDPDRHLITNSFSTVGTEAVWSIPDIDLTQTHRYGDDGSIPDIAAGLPADALAHARYGKPHLLGEFGIAWQNSDEQYDSKGVGTNLHNGLWGSAFSGDVGGGAIWWWDSYVQPEHLYSQFTGLAEFARTVDWPHRAFEPVSLATPTVAPKGPETFSDLTLAPTTGWGAKSTRPIVVRRDGQVEASGSLLSLLYGPDKPDLRSALTFDINLSRPSTLTLHILTVSNRANLRVSVDGRTAADLPFDASPGKGQDFASTHQYPEYGGIYQAVFNKDRTVALPAGHHRVTLENTDGDWMQIGSYRFAGVVSSHFASLRPYALQDAATGETLVWLEDPASDWQNDRDGVLPVRHSGVSLSIPLPCAGRFQVLWWDTRLGRVIARRAVVVKGNAAHASLLVPSFSRDIALRITAFGPPPQRTVRVH